MRIPDCACFDVRILGPKPEIWVIDLSSAMVGMLMSSSKLFLFSHEAHLDSGPVHPYLHIFENGDFFPYLKKIRVRKNMIDILSGERVQKPPYLWSKMLFTCGWEVQTEKNISVFENIRILAETACGIVLCFSRQACCLLCQAVCATLTMAVTLASLLVSFCSSVSGCGVVSDLNKNIGGSTDLAKKSHGFAYPYPLLSTVD